MAKKFLVLTIAVLVFISCADTKSPERKAFALKDDLGNEITFDKAPQRI